MKHRSFQIGLTRRPGFTLIELMVAVAVVIVLISLLIVALTQAQRSAQTINTRALMATIDQALVQFREDVGYLPPVLSADRTLVGPPPLNVGSFDGTIQDWFSETSLADFLVGWDHAQHDGFGFVPPSDGGPLFESEVPAVGIRDPGRDGVWGAGLTGTVSSRNPVNTGKVFGPYLKLDNPRLLVAINRSGGPTTVLFPGDPGYDNPANPKAIADYWGTPIRYYRRAYHPGSIKQDYRPTGIDTDGDSIADEFQRVPTLSNVILLRPQSVTPESTIEDARTIGDRSIDLTSIELQSAQFALFSRGPDLLHNPLLRIDDPQNPGETINLDTSGDILFKFTNRDNIVEVGK